MRFLSFCAFIFLCSNLTSQSILGRYVGSKEPVIFFKGSVSVDGIQWNNAMDTYGNLYLTQQLATRSQLVIYRATADGFESAEVIPLDTNAVHSDIWVSPKGDQIIFMSTMPSEIGENGFNLWMSTKTEEEWQQPEEIHKATSGLGGEAYPWRTNSGNLYFSVARDGSRNSDIYLLKNGSDQAISLPETVNSKAFEGDAYVSPDESYIIFAAFDRPDGLGLSDLFISFRTADNNWTPAKSLGVHVNSEGYDGSPVISPDGRFLLFTSSRASVGLEKVFFNHYIMEFEPELYR